MRWIYGLRGMCGFSGRYEVRVLVMIDMGRSLRWVYCITSNWFKRWMWIMWWVWRHTEVVNKGTLESLGGVFVIWDGRNGKYVGLSRKSGCGGYTDKLDAAYVVCVSAGVGIGMECLVDKVSMDHIVGVVRYGCEC